MPLNYTFCQPNKRKNICLSELCNSHVLPLEQFLARQNEGQTLSPAERAAKLIEDSKAVIIHGGQEAYYDKQRDAIFMPEPEHFENETKYFQAAIHQLAHWTGHEDRLNRPMEGKFASLNYAREELRAAVAAILIGGELKIGHNFGQQAAYMNNFARILKDEPFEIAKASRDAQKIANLLLGVSQKREQKQGPQAIGFQRGDEIAYMDTTYKVIETYKTKSIKVEDADGSRKVLKPEYGLYQSLLEAKAGLSTPEMVLEEGRSQSEEQGQKQKTGR